MKNIEELQNRLKAAEAEIAEVRRLMHEEESKSNPPKWEDLDEIKGYYIATISNVIELSKGMARVENSNTFPTKEQAEATIAEAKLLQLRDSKFYRNGWKPDWNDGSTKFAILVDCGGFYISRTATTCEMFSFQDKKTAERFLNDQCELLEVWAKKIRS